MAHHDYIIGNQSFPSARADLNNALAAIASNNSGTEPSTTYAHMWWYDTTANILKIRNGDNNAWVNVVILDAAITSSNTELNLLNNIAQGSLVYGDASSNTALLVKGAAGTVLTSDGTDISWADPAAQIPSLTRGQIVVGNSSSQTVALAAGASKAVLTMDHGGDGDVVWTAEKDVLLRSGGEIGCYCLAGHSNGNIYGVGSVAAGTTLRLASTFATSNTNHGLSDIAPAGSYRCQGEMGRNDDVATVSSKQQCVMVWQRIL